MNIQTGKKYRYRFPLLAVIIAAVGSVVAVGCIVVNLLRFISFYTENVDPGIYEYMSLIVSVALSIAFIVFASAALIKSYYTVTEKSVILKWGLIKNVIDIKEVKEIKFLTKTQKLELVFDDESYFVIAVGSPWKEEFVAEIKEKFPKIPFTQITEENKEE